MKKKIIPLTFLLLFGFTALTACNSSKIETTALSPDTAQTRTASTGSEHAITVNSSEKVTIIPDIAEIVYAVQTQNKDAATCHQKNAEDVNKVIDLLKSLGIADTSIQTSDYYMRPVYSYSNNTEKITGYEATTTLTVSDLPIDNLGNILTNSVNAGINTVQSITYESSKYDEGYQQALKLAVERGHAKAQILADASGSKLTNVAQITENSNYSQARYTDNTLTNKLNAKQEMLTDATAPDIMPGEIDVQVDITIQYLIQ